MAIKNCLILAAGMGTRMGKVGEILPKPLWPLGSKTFLSHQYSVAKALGVENIHVNVCHKTELICDYIKKNKLDINIHIENPVLDVGGTVQHLSNYGVKGNCLILNCDQLICNSTDNLQSLIESHRDESVATLASVIVESEEKYNRFRVSDNVLERVVPFQESLPADKTTYAGLGVINLTKIKVDNRYKYRNLFELLYSNKKSGNIETKDLLRDVFHDVGTRANYLSFIFNPIMRAKFPCLRLDNYLVKGYYNFSADEWKNAPEGSVILNGPEEALKNNLLQCPRISI